MKRDMDSAIVFDVQRFSVHDGPGIRTTVFFKGCPLRCAWCQNPEALRPNIEMMFYADRCMDSGGCHAICPRGAIDAGKERVLREQCDGCGLCVPACPFGALQRIGREVPIAELLAELERDRPFFESSGGGVTFSGGEPTFQMSAMGELARQCKKVGLSVLLQTCGAFPWEGFAPHRDAFSFVHFDLKLLDAERHRHCTGADNRTILENARAFVREGPSTTFRMPIIPGITDTEENLTATARFLWEIGSTSLHLLKYHCMGEAKLPRLGFPIAPLGLAGAQAAEESLKRADAHLRALGIETTT